MIILMVLTQKNTINHNNPRARRREYSDWKLLKTKRQCAYNLFINNNTIL